MLSGDSAQQTSAGGAPSFPTSSVLRLALLIALAVTAALLERGVGGAAHLTTARGAPETRSARASKARVAVCFSGQPRSLLLKPADALYKRDGWGMRVSAPLTGSPASDLGGHSLAELVHLNLYPSVCGGGSNNVAGSLCSIFVVIGVKDPEQERAAQAACTALRPNSSGADFLCETYDESREVLLWADSPVWRRYYYTADRQHGGLLQQLYGMFRCHEAMVRHEIETGERFDLVMRARLDSAFFAPFPDPFSLDVGTPGARRFLVMDKRVCCCGNEDWFGFGERDVMGHYLRRFLHLQQLPFAGHYNPPGDTTRNLPAGKWDAEGFLLQHMAEVNAVPAESAAVANCLLRKADHSNGQG